MLGSGVPSIDYKPGPKMCRSVLELRGTRGQERCELAFHIRGGRMVALNQEGLSQRSDEVPICDRSPNFCVLWNFLAACDITDYERDFRGAAKLEESGADNNDDQRRSLDVGISGWIARSV